MRILSIIGVVVGAIMVLSLIFVALFANTLAKHDPYRTNIADRLLLPPQQNSFDIGSQQYPFGTDNLGRDVQAVVFHGLGTTLVTSSLAVAISLVAGAFLGIGSALLEMIAGEVGAVVKKTVIYLARFLSAGPGILLAFAVAAMYTEADRTLIIAAGIAIVLTPGFIRLFSGLALCIKDNNAIKSLLTIIGRTSLNMGLAVLLYSGFSFIGMGMPIPTPELGSMVAVGRDFMRHAPYSHAPYLYATHMVVYPGLAIAALALSFNILGESLNSIALTSRKRTAENQQTYPPHYKEPQPHIQ